MGTILFLVFIGLCAFAVVLWSRHSSKAQHLHKQGYSAGGSLASDKLMPTSENKLSSKEDVWQARRDFATKDVGPSRKFIPRSEAADEPEYDGYSRRDRHHLTTKGQVKDESQAF